VANILLARVLAPRAFGTLSLMLALIQIAVSFGPMGLDLAINRHRLDASAALVSWTLGTSTVVAVALAVAAAQIYGMPTALTACLAVAAAGASMNSIGGALLRAREQFTLSLLLFRVHNYVLFAAAGLASGRLESRSAQPC
jgi:O-antigen/teichoic acid export membrane protein